MPSPAWEPLSPFPGTASLYAAQSRSRTPARQSLARKADDPSESRHTDPPPRALATPVPAFAGRPNPRIFPRHPERRAVRATPFHRRRVQPPSRDPVDPRGKQGIARRRAESRRRCSARTRSTTKTTTGSPAVTRATRDHYSPALSTPLYLTIALPESPGTWRLSRFGGQLIAEDSCPRRGVFYRGDERVKDSYRRR